MSVRILHAADFHMDSPFHALPEEKAKLRRHEQRAILARLRDAVKAEGAQIVLLAGDLFDSAMSYWETQEALAGFFAGIDAHIFIAPGNHDYFTSRSPYAFMELPENVHIFRSPSIKCVELPELSCRVWGAGFIAAACDGLLERFLCGTPDGTVELMVLHGDLTGGRYDPVTEEQIAASGLDYLALGHLHAFSGIQKAGNTFYAYPGCLEGRGFDETGEKGVIAGTVGKGVCDLRFLPIPGRQYKIIDCDVTGAEDLPRAVSEAIGAGEADNILRVVLMGEGVRRPDLDAILSACGERCFHLTLRDETVKKRALWEGADDDSLRGLFLSRMRALYEKEKDPAERERVLLAVRYGLAALDGREEWQP